MKRALVVLSMAVLLTATALAGGQGKKQKLSGYLVDIMCSSEHASEGDAFGAKHSKECLQMADCEKSGYAVLTADKKVIKFDAQGNEEAKKAIAASSKDKDFKVTVSGVVNGDTITVAALQIE
ncbi:MAG: hypothetical protein ACREB3_17115 [Burkholderiales bacterium]